MERKWQDAKTAFIAMKASNTQRQYRGVIRDWEKFLKVRGINPLKADTTDATAHLAEQSERPAQVLSEARGQYSAVSAATIRRKAIILSALYEHIDSELPGFRNPFKRLAGRLKNGAAPHRRPTTALEVDEVSRLLNSPSTLTIDGIRDRAFLAALFGGGLRLNEVIQLTVSDIFEESDGTTYLRLLKTKSQQTEEQVLPEWAAGSLKALVEQRRQQGANRHSKLFVLYQGSSRNQEKPLLDRTSRRLFKRLASRVGLGPEVTPHSARATAITRLRKLGLDTKEVQSFSRHKSSRMIDVYDKRAWNKSNSPAKKLIFN